MHIRAQNAGLILRQQSDDMIFESFEASPPNEQIMSTSGRLICSFPGPIISVPLDTAQNPKFLTPLCHFLERMDVEELEPALTINKKAGNKIVETRDTTHPMFITEMLTGILRGVGSPVQNARRIQKCYRDDINWASAKLPWRRSPLWLVLKIALQTTLQYKSLYKSVMLHFMIQFLRDAIVHEMDSEILSVMGSKISRRYMKMLDRSLPVPVALVQSVLEIGNACRELLEDRWNTIQSKLAERTAWNPESLKFDKDTKMSLINSRKYIRSVISRMPQYTPVKSFNPSEAQRISTSAIDMPHLSTAGKSESDIYVLLQDFENWIAVNIVKWSKCNRELKPSCKKLQYTMQRYESIARPRYQSSPTNWSILVLTLVEMWVALDETAIHQLPLLSEYHPELTTNFFHPLILRKRADMERLYRVEAYIKNRVTNAQNYNMTRIFSDDITAQSFAVQYTRHSTTHRYLLQAIMDDAHKAKCAKEKEYSQLSHDYHKLVNEAKYLSHTLSPPEQIYGALIATHNPDCWRCALMNDAKRIEIMLHEWPLPRNDVEAHAVVFELECPQDFVIWRDNTYRILVDIIGICSEDSVGRHARKLKDLRNYSELEEYFNEKNQRLTFRSTTKSMLESHYNGLHFPVDIDMVCVNNGMKWHLYDADKERFVKDILGEASTDGAPYEPYTFGISLDGPYAHLAQSFSAGALSSNEILAAQSQCPSDLSLQEHHSFGHFRTGLRVQWLNIARELREQNLSHSHEDVGLLIMQTIWQAGPAELNYGFRRDSHELLCSMNICQDMLIEVDRLLNDICENWSAIVTAHSLIIITARIINLGPKEIKPRASAVLKKARNITHRWTRDLGKLLGSSQKDEKQRISGIFFRAASVCHATLDVDDRYVHWVLQDDEDILSAIECAIIAHDCLPLKDSAAVSSFDRHLVDANKRINHTLEHHIQRIIVTEKRYKGIDSCIKYAWNDFYRSSTATWTACNGNNSRWITAKSVSNGRRGEVFLNILTGQLLVNGSALRRLPEKYSHHPLYRRTFGDVCYVPSYTLNVQILIKRRAFLMFPRGAEIWIFRPDIALKGSL